MHDLIGERDLPSLLDERVERDPDKVWLTFEDADGDVQEYTYAGFREAADRVAGGFAGLGVEPGDRVGIHLPNCPEFLLGFFALARLGAIAVPSNVANQAAEMRHVLNHSGARLLVTSAAYREMFEEALADAPAVERTVLARGGDPGGGVAFEELLDSAPIGEQPVRHPETPVQMIFTSGTTAQPKGVVLTHANCLWSGERAARSLQLDDSDRLLTALPVFHVNAQSFSVLPSLTVSGGLVMLEGFRASRFIEQAHRHQATQTSLVAMLLRTLLAQPPGDLDRAHRLRRVVFAINVSEAERQEFERRFGVEMVNAYGLSEAMTAVSISPVNGPRRWPSVGLPALDRVVRILDEEGHEVSDGDVGEIAVRGVPGRTIMKEYFRDPEATARAISDGWLRTGDNGYLDERGYLYFYDRSKDIIKRAGENISASEVEAVLGDHPAIAQAAVIAAPDPVRDEAVKAYVVLEEGEELGEDDLLEHCRARLASFKLPTIVEFRERLPLTSIGKIEKKVLRAETWTEKEEARS